MASLSTQILSSCGAETSVISAVLISGAPGTSPNVAYTWTVIDQATLIDYGGPVNQGDSVNVPNGVFNVRVNAVYDDDPFTTANSITHRVLVACEQTTPSPVYLTVSWMAPTPAPAGGYEVRYRVRNSTDPHTVALASSSPYSVLVPRGYSYEVIVRAICSPGVYSSPISYP